MNVLTLINRAELTARGKAGTVTPTRKAKYLALANMLQDDWLAEPNVQWNSRYDRLSLGTITSDRVDMDDDVFEISKREGDYITIVNTDGTVISNWSLVDPNEFRRYRYDSTCAWIGDELVFARSFVTGTPEYGKEVIVPVTLKLDALVNDDDEVQVDDPNWLVYRIAAETVRNTVTKVNNYPALVDLANNAMIGMKDRNNSQINYIQMSPSVLGESWDSGGTFYGGYANTYGQPLGLDE